MFLSPDTQTITSNRPLKKRFAVSGFVLAAALLALLLMATLCAAGAQWNPKGVPVCKAANNQYDQHVLSDGAGGTFVVWADQRTSGDTNVFAQRIDAGGRPLWTENGIPVVNATDEQYNPRLTTDGAGGIIVSWQDSRSNWVDIYAQRLDGSGKALWKTNGVPVDNTPGNYKYNPEIASDGVGGAIIIYVMWIYPNYGIFAQRINQSGATQWAAPVMLTNNGDYYNHAITQAEGGGAIAAWQDLRNSPSSSDVYDIFAQKLDNAGSQKWTANGAPVCTARDTQLYPQMVSDEAGGTIITWQDGRSTNGFDIYAQRMKSSGSPAWKKNGVRVCGAEGDQQDPMLTADGSGGAIVTWSDNRAGSSKIYAQKLSAGGSARWASNGVILNPGGGSSYEPVITSDGSGGAIVAWTRGNYDGGREIKQGMDIGERVFVQQVLSGGTISPGWAPAGAPVVPISASTENVWPQITTDGSGGAIVVWEDYRSDNEDLYAQRMRTTTAAWYLAEGSSAWGYETYITIQNPNPKQVTAKITYMTPDGPAKPQKVVLPASSQTTVHPLDYLKYKMDFSTKVECLEGKPIGVDRTMIWTGQGAPSSEGHSSIGVNAAAYTWYLPEGSSGYGFETWILVQNPTSKDATCTLTYMIEGANPATVMKTVPAHSRNTFNMASDIGAQNASTRVSSNVPVIVERAMYRNNRREGHGSIGATEAATDYFLAEGSTAYGFTTYVLVENPNADACNVNLTYMTPKGPKAMEPFSMPGYSRKTVRVNDELSNTDFSTQVHADQPVIAERAMYWGAETPLGEAMHDTIGMVTPSGLFYLPDGQTADNHETYTMVQNPNDTPVEVQISYLTPDGKDDVTFTENVPALSRVTFNMTDKIKSGRAAVMVECMTKGKSVMAERSIYWNNRGGGTCTIGGASY